MPVEPSAAEAEIQALKRQLAAKDKTLAVLIRRVEADTSAGMDALTSLRTLHDLEQLVSLKSSELEAERSRLADALIQLGDAQDKVAQLQKLKENSPKPA